MDPYPVPSHRQFRETYLTGSRFTWTTVQLPAQGWRWRLRTAGAIFAQQLRSECSAGDLILTTSMLDASQLRAYLPAGVRIVQYFHENQLTYARKSTGRIENALRHIHSCLAADRILFNSEYHRNNFADALVREQQNWDPVSRFPEIIDLVQHADVIYPGIDCPPPTTARIHPPLILWNHRWCTEKQPEEFCRAIDRLAEKNISFRLAIVGSTNEKPLECFEQLLQRHHDTVIAWGYQGREDYRRLLTQAQVCISTASEENFGLSVLEALAAGAHLLLPNQLVYPELYDNAPGVHFYASPAELDEQLVTLMANNVDQASLISQASWCANHFSASRMTAQLDDVVGNYLDPDPVLG